MYEKDPRDKVSTVAARSEMTHIEGLPEGFKVKKGAHFTHVINPAGHSQEIVTREASDERVLAVAQEMKKLMDLEEEVFQQRARVRDVANGK